MGPVRQREKGWGLLASQRKKREEGDQRGWADSWAEAGGKGKQAEGGGLAGPPAAAALASFFPFYFSKAFFEREF